MALIAAWSLDNTIVTGWGLDPRHRVAFGGTRDNGHQSQDPTAWGPWTQIWFLVTTQFWMPPCHRWQHRSLRLIWSRWQCDQGQTERNLSALRVYFFFPLYNIGFCLKTSGVYKCEDLYLGLWFRSMDSPVCSYDNTMLFILLWFYSTTWNQWWQYFQKFFYYFNYLIFCFVSLLHVNLNSVL